MVVMLNMRWHTSRNWDKSLTSTAVCNMTFLFKIITII